MSTDVGPRSITAMFTTRIMQSTMRMTSLEVIERSPRMRWPFRYVPFVLFRSWRKIMPREIEMRAWRRDTLGSSRTTSQTGSLPRTISSLSNSRRLGVFDPGSEMSRASEEVRTVPSGVTPGSVSGVTPEIGLSNSGIDPRQ